jgi:CubicO group peptidase (beta-lactamase class C family)
VPTLLQVLDGVKPANSPPIRVDLVPGSQFRYSGGGYSVLQQLLIDVMGKPFPELMRELVFAPLKMNRSIFEQPLSDKLRTSAAAAHTLSGERLQGKWRIHPELAAAGMWSTPSDLARLLIEVQESGAGRSGKVFLPRRSIKC